jgi:hypothetical protein
MKYYLISILVLLFYGCSPSYQIETIRDQFDGYTLYRVKENILADYNKPFLGGGQEIHLKPQLFVNKEGEKTFSLLLRYKFSTWIFIKEGESLILMVDNVRIGFSGDGSNQHRDTYIDYHKVVADEVAIYITDELTLKQICNGKSVQVKIIGESYSITRYFDANNFKNFRQFFSDYCKK